MIHLSKPPFAFVLSSLLAGLALTGCGAQRAPRSTAPMASPSSVESAGEEDSAVDGDEGADEALLESKAKAGAAPPEEEAAEEEQAPAPASASANAEKPAGQLVDELDTELLALESSLQPEKLSCEGAKPHQKAICSIAARICEMEQPSTTKSPDCRKAQESCKKAQERYLEKCN